MQYTNKVSDIANPESKSLRHDKSDDFNCVQNSIQKIDFQYKI